MKKLFLLLSLLPVLSIGSCTKDAVENSNLQTPRTEVPDELVGAWEAGAIDFVFWENYKQGFYAGRNAIPTREAMLFAKNGEARFYRYEFAFGAYEELIDCNGTVAFDTDGTFTFYPLSGRKRYYSTRHPEDNKDRALSASELTNPKIAGKRGYTYIGSAAPPVMKISVPGSATYNWYKKF